MPRVRNEGVRGSSPLSSTRGISRIPSLFGRGRHDEGRPTTGQVPFVYLVIAQRHTTGSNVLKEASLLDH